MDSSPPQQQQQQQQQHNEDAVDTSTFNSPMATIPTFTQRKSNRASVLAYSVNGTQPQVPGPSTSPSTGLPLSAQGGPPSLFGASGTSTPSPPSSQNTSGGPPPAAGGIKLPPPPMKGTDNPVAPIPYTKGDFRTAEIVNHWNDPPTQIFQKKTSNTGTEAHDFGPMKTALTNVIQECSAKVSAPQKRMFDDTTKRLQTLLDQMDNNSVKERVIAPLGDMIQGKESFLFSSFILLPLSTKSFTECHAIHAKLMQTDFDSEGKWLLGFKRLIDLYAS
ncbi:hypothetical protein BGZ94_002406 [Podila epigama]|nr:hypothetical protein BGZ94_002406 [Podila epigama]